MQSEFLATRLSRIGIQEIPQIYLSLGPYSKEKPLPVPMFVATEQGFEIPYFLPQGGRALYEFEYQNGEPSKSEKELALQGKAKKKTKKPLVRTRFAPGFDKKNKYSQDFGSGLCPYYPLQIIEKYQAKTTIERLVLTEGEIKAWALNVKGVDAVGLMGISGLGDSQTKDENGKTTELHYTLIELIQRCNVKHLIFLTDADTFTLTYAPDKDLYERAASFYSAVYRFSAFAQDLLQEDSGLKTLLFKAGNKRTLHFAKGVDDLLEARPESATEITKELTNLTGKDNFFESYTVTHLATRSAAHKKASKTISDALRERFGLLHPSNFYQQYRTEIGYQPFVYRGGTYEPTKLGTVKLKYHPLSARFFRVTDKWFSVTAKPNEFGEMEPELRPFGIKEIERDGKGVYGFVDSLPRFTSFINVPDFTTNYKRNYKGFYNMAHPLPYALKEGQFPFTSMFLNHIAGQPVSDNPQLATQTGNLATVLLDWLTIAIKYPTHKLPVLLLVSPENNTGKSTFLNFCCMLFGTANSAILSKEQFTTPFNAHFISKHFIGVDEGFIESEKKAEKESFKQLVTSRSQLINFKGVDRVKMSFHGKVVICGNDDKRIMQMDDLEDRWFVIRVRKFITENPDLELQLKKELPAFAHFLLNREPHHPRKKRFWFERDLYITDQFNSIVKHTKSFLEQHIDEYVEEGFLTHKPTDKKLHYDTRHLIAAINQVSKYKVDAISIKQYLVEKRKLQKAESGYHTILGTTIEMGEDKMTINRTCRPWVFNAQDWLTPEQLTQAYRNQPAPQAALKLTEEEQDDLPF